MTPAGGVDPIHGRVRGGDEITVSILMQGDDLVINLVNETRGWGVGSVWPDAGGDLAMVAVGDARLTVEGEPLAVPAFGRHVFSELAVDGSPPDPDLAFWMPLVDGKGSYLIRPTRLRDDPTTFTNHSMT